MSPTVLRIGHHPHCRWIPAIDPRPLAPVTDFFDNLRKGNKAVDAGAVEYEPVATAVLTVTSTRLAFTGVVRGTTQTSTLTGTAN
jgi:hypothetical protein